MEQWLPEDPPQEREIKAGRKIHAGPPLVLSGGFALLILLGTLLLKLPVATTHSIDWMQALFTATSAVTVTGLSVVEAGSDFTFFGQVVIIGLIQFGGLGFMTFAVVTLLALGGKIGFFQQSVAKEAFNQTDTSAVSKTAWSVLWFSLFVETIGVVVLAAYWAPDLGWRTALWHGIFYTVSAFNNAGFSLDSNSLTTYVSDPLINLTITGLFITGGLGFTVWREMWEERRWHRLSVYSKMMLIGTLILNVVALLLFYLIEKNNPATLGALDEGGKWLAAWFQAVTPRTAGFNTIPIDALEGGSTSLTLLLMFIGGGSLSTASGIKVVTFMVLCLATYSFLRRDNRVTIYSHTLAIETVRKALALTVISAGTTWFCVFLLLLTEKDAAFLDVVFEAVSALGTVGLSRGLTSQLTDVGEVIIILLMYVGRLGPLTLAYLLASPRTRMLEYPETKLAVG